MAMSVDELLKAANELNGADLDHLTHEVLMLRAQRRVPMLSGLETALFLRINQGVPEAIEAEYQALARRREESGLVGEPLARLLELSDRIEVLAAERAGALVELAEVRGVPLMQLMDELGIRMSGFERLKSRLHKQNLPTQVKKFHSRFSILPI
jgi:hypothetical protein